MAFEARIESAVASAVDFKGVPPCRCGKKTAIAIATVANIHNGQISVGAASEFCGRDKERRPNKILLPHYALQDYKGYCTDCWHQSKAANTRTYDSDLVRKAWMWFIGRISQGSENFGGLFSSEGNIPLEAQEEYLMIVNKEARRCNNPESVPDEYKITEVWR